MINNHLEVSIQIAALEAQKRGKSIIGSEHVLIGLLLNEECLASKFLKAQNISIDKIDEILNTEQSKEVLEPPYDIFTPKVKALTDNATLMACDYGLNELGTEQFLIAILKDKNCFANKILTNLNFNIDQTIDEITNLHKSNIKNNNTRTNYEKNSSLDKYCRNLNLMAQNNKFDPIIGREDEVDRIIQVLARRTKNNPCLVGEPGVGKTAIIEGLAQRIVNRDVPEILFNKKILNLNLTSLVAGSKYRGEFEEKIKKLIDEAANDKSVILFIDEIHTIVGAGGSTESSMDAANILKPYLTRGELQIIGSTTFREYKKYIEKDTALERRFQPIKIMEPTEDETIEILQGIKHKYEEFHNVIVGQDAVESAVKLSMRYINDRFLPDKAIDLLDEACAKAKLSQYSSSKNIRKIKLKLNKLQLDKENAIKNEDYIKAQEIKITEVKLNNKIKSYNQKLTKPDINPFVNAENIAEIVAKWTKIPVDKLTETENKKLLNIENVLHQRVIGQNEAIESVAKAIRRSRVGLKDAKRVVGSFLFLGNSGIGKSELAKTLAEALFESEKNMIRIDMSEYTEKHSVSKLIGSPPGYVGYDESGQLTEKVRRNPYSVILFDEIEKAHPDIFNSLLQVLEDGILTDSHGKTVDFKNTIIIMTSNTGSKNITEKSKTVGFGSDNDIKFTDIQDKINKELKDIFRPEFLNRIDDIIIFQPLTMDEIKQITDLMIKNLNVRLKNINVEINLTETARDYFAEKGYDPKYGARPLRRLIQNEIENKISELILSNEIKLGNVSIDYDGEKLIYS